MPDSMITDRQTCAVHIGEGIADDAHIAECGPCHRTQTIWNPSPPIHVAHEGFTSTGGYRYQATEDTRHAGPVALVELTNRDDQPGARPVSLEPDEASDLGLWLLRGVVAHEPDEEVRALLTARIDALSRELASLLVDQR